MKQWAQNFVRAQLARQGFVVQRAGSAHDPARLYGKDFLEVWEACRPFTMTSIERAHGLYLAVNYIIDRGLQGDFIECGVWRGGSSMIMAHTLLRRGAERRLFLYDTFAGMSEPTDADVTDFSEQSTRAKWQSYAAEGHNDWCYASLEDVQSNMAATGYPAALTHFVKGKVEETLPAASHGAIALLRLDTDWYESTRAEMELLYPSLVRGGVLILDDYGHWQGARKAVDEYLAAQAEPLLLMPLDYTGRIAVRA